MGLEYTSSCIGTLSTNKWYKHNTSIFWGATGNFMCASTNVSFLLIPFVKEKGSLILSYVSSTMCVVVDKNLAT